MRQMFSVHATPEEFKNESVTGQCWFVFAEKVRLQNVFIPHKNENPAFTISSRLKSVFEKLRMPIRINETTAFSNFSGARWTLSETPPQQASFFAWFFTQSFRSSYDPLDATYRDAIIINCVVIDHIIIVLGSCRDASVTRRDWSDLANMDFYATTSGWWLNVTV